MAEKERSFIGIGEKILGIGPTVDIAILGIFSRPSNS